MENKTLALLNLATTFYTSSNQHECRKNTKCIYFKVCRLSDSENFERLIFVTKIYGRIRKKITESIILPANCFGFTTDHCLDHCVRCARIREKYVSQKARILACFT